MKSFVLVCCVVGSFALRACYGQLQAGASAVDITPTVFPVIQNGGFLEGQIHLATEKLHARCLALDDGKTRLAMVIVDSCMIPRDLCDQVKQTASTSTGLSTDRILIAATHTHSAPSVMNYCLGSRADPQYTAFLPGKIVQAIEQAVARLEPAQAAWGRVDAGAYTNCRRWITRADAMQDDPFGDKTVRAMMHPGYQNPAFVGPSGPKDPWLSFLSVRSTAGKPLALLGNFSMHYFGGHPGASPDYCGQFARQMADRLAPEDATFVGLLSQGTSGDLWWADYGQPQVDREIASYTGALVDLVAEAQATLEHRADVDLAMAETRMTLGRRLPDEARLAWARATLKAMDGRRPKARPEVYAEQAVYLHEHPAEEIVLQAIRVGELGIVAMPNEVYALTGLKLKAQSPLNTTCSIELANGAAGYIPPREQHALGGYTTWPARTAGLEESAESKIVEGALSLLEIVSGKPRRVYSEPTSAYAAAVLASKPDSFWRLGEMSGDQVQDLSGHERHGLYVGTVAYHLPGIPGEKYASHAAHFVGGAIHRNTGSLPPETYTLVLWLWNGVANEATDLAAIRETLGMGKDGRLFIANEGGHLDGKTMLDARQWHHVALIRKGDQVTLVLNGDVEVMGELPGWSPGGETFEIGSKAFQGKLDEVAIYHRTLDVEQITSLFATVHR